MCFPLHAEKVVKEANFWGKNINLYCLPLTELNIRWNLATFYNRFRDQFKKKNKEMEKEEKEN